MKHLVGACRLKRRNPLCVYKEIHCVYTQLCIQKPQYTIADQIWDEVENGRVDKLAELSLKLAKWIYKLAELSVLESFIGRAQLQLGGSPCQGGLSTIQYPQMQESIPTSARKYNSQFPQVLMCSTHGVLRLPDMHPEESIFTEKYAKVPTGLQNLRSNWFRQYEETKSNFY